MNFPSIMPGKAPADPTGFEAFFDFLQEPGAGVSATASVLSARRYVAALDIDLQTLANQARVHRDIVARAPGCASVQHFLHEAIRVIRAASDLSGDLRRALFWYRNAPLAVFDYQTAETVVSAGRAEDVLRYVASLDAGAGG